MSNQIIRQLRIGAIMATIVAILAAAAAAEQHATVDDKAISSTGNL